MFDLPCPEVSVAVEVVREGSKQQEGRLDSGQMEPEPNPKRRWIEYLRYLNCMTPVTGRLGKLLAFVYILTINLWLLFQYCEGEYSHSIVFFTTGTVCRRLLKTNEKCLLQM